MGRININQFKKELIAQADRAGVTRQVYALAEEELEIKKEKLISNFLDHEVTQEIQAGPTVEGGLLSYGNLYSLLGFDHESNQADQQIDAIIDKIKHEIKLIEKARIKDKGKSRLTWDFSLFVPTEVDFINVTQLPWGRSWLKMLEQGIPGFNMYMFELERNFKNSYSTTAIQIENPIRNRPDGSGLAGTAPKFSNYFLTMYRNFIKNINK